MSSRLGEMLLKVGALSKKDLEQVLRAQAIYGGRLGTNLVEMGLVEEEELARLLSEQLGVSCIEPGRLEGIPKTLLRVVPREMVERYRVLPVALEGKRLTLAMANPSDFKAIDEIGFGTGMVIVARICSELRLSFALEKYYGIKRPVRYIPMEGGLMCRDTTAAAAWARDAVHLPAPERVPVKDLAQRLSRASGETAVVHALVAYLAGEFDRGAFLRLGGGMLRGVQAVSDGVLLQAFAVYAAQVEQTQELRRVVEERRVFLGEMGKDAADGALLEAMGAKSPAPALLVPVSLGGLVAGVICASDMRGRLGGGTFDLQRVAVMAELTFEMLSLRKRIVAG